MVRPAAVTGRASFCDVSRILFPLARAAIIHLVRMTERPAPLWRRFAHFRRFGTAKVVQGATNTRDLNFPLARKKSGRRPYLCFVLHRMGFLMRPRLHE